MRPSSNVRRNDSRFIQAIINTSCVSTPWVIAATSPSALKLTCASWSGDASILTPVGMRPTLEIEACAGFDPFGGHGVQIALAQHDVVLALDLDLVAVVGAEQHAVTRLGAAHV